MVAVKNQNVPKPVCADAEAFMSSLNYARMPVYISLTDPPEIFILIAWFPKCSSVDGKWCVNVAFPVFKFVSPNEYEHNMIELGI